MAKTDHIHVDDVEAAAAEDPLVGAGTPEDAPEIDVDEDPSGLPTRKLVAGAVTGLILYALGAVVEVAPAIENAATVVGMVAAAYIVPNLPTPGGVPHK